MVNTGVIGVGDVKRVVVSVNRIAQDELKAVQIRTKEGNFPFS